MKSGQFIYYFVLISSILFFAVAVVISFFAEPKEEPFYFILVFPILLALAVRYCMTRLSVATLDEHSITIKTLFNKNTFSWEEISGIYKISFLIPRVFLIKIKGDKKTYSFFSLGNQYLMDGFTKNPLSLENFIDRKIKEHGIRDLE